MAGRDQKPDFAKVLIQKLEEVETPRDFPVLVEELLAIVDKELAMKQYHNLYAICRRALVVASQYRRSQLMAQFFSLDTTKFYVPGYNSHSIESIADNTIIFPYQIKENVFYTHSAARVPNTYARKM